MAVLCPQYGLLFVGAYRTGSTAISQALIANAGGRYVPAAPMKDGDTVVVSKQHSSIADLVGHNLLDRPADSLLKFTVVRLSLIHI